MVFQASYDFKLFHDRNSKTPQELRVNLIFPIWNSSVYFLRVTIEKDLFIFFSELGQAPFYRKSFRLKLAVKRMVILMINKSMIICHIIQRVQILYLSI